MQDQASPHDSDPISRAAAVDQNPEVALSHEEIQRYSRHLVIPEVGMAGQKKLKAGSVLLVGAGGLGSPLAMYLAAAGVGRMGLIDFDLVEHSNLHRQIIHGTSDVGRPKLQSAIETINDINPNVVIEGYDEPLTSQNALPIMSDFAIVIDGTDNFPTRYLVNDASVMLDKPNVYGSIFRFEGQASVFHHAQGPCYRCLYPEPPPPGLVPSCAEGGVLGVLPGLVGLIQATEGIKLLLGLGDSLSGRLLLVNALKMSFRELKVRRNPNCPLCGDDPTIRELIDYDQFCGVPAASRTAKPVDRPQQTPWDISVAELKQLRDTRANFFLLDVREPHEYTICNLGGTLVPLDQLSERIHELDKEADIIVHCKVGARSAMAVHALRDAGFEKVRNLQGGIEAWSDEIDSSLPRY